MILHNNKKLIIAAILIIAVFAIAYLANRGLSGRYPGSGEGAITDRQAADLNGQTPKDEPEKKDKRIEEVKVFNTATGQKDAKQCEGIGDSYVRDLCFKKIAVEQSDAQSCQYIEDGNTRDMCGFTVYKNKAIQEKKIEPCDEIENNLLVYRCKERALNGNFCPDMECYKEFIDSGKNIDSDSDGLLDSVELLVYRTDPGNPDTDGDGYLDGDEVRGGYNPLGDGVLK